MDGQARKFRLALTLGFGLLLTAILIFVGSIVLETAGANDLSRGIVKDSATGPNTGQADVTLSLESLFDKLFRQQKNGDVAYDIPFPFTTLTRRIAANLAAPQGKAPSLLQVLIPLGRSLQRYAAEPEYFRYPRVIVAVDSEPAASPSHAGILLRDRLYLGYQERANTIEVISYNEDAGRFEFQVVYDYAPGLTPTVSPANRNLCMGCHQNGGPIWSEPPWEETNNNPRIVSLLQEQNRSFHGAPVNLAFQGADTAFRIGSSIDRANLFASHQQLWQHACGKSARCRGDIFAFMLQYRLSGNRGYDLSSKRFEDAFQAGWREHWPDGLPIQSPRIPNRNPLDASTSIPGILDPLEPRPHTISIRPSDRGAVDSVIVGLSEFLADIDIRILDDYLSEDRQDPNTARRLLKTACAFTKTDLGDWAKQVRFSCGGQGADQMRLDGQFYMKRGQATRGTIERLSIGKSERLIKLKISGPEIAYGDSGAEIILELEEPIGGIHAWLINGEALESLTLRWDKFTDENAGPSDELRRHPDNGTSILRVANNFGALKAAINALVKQTEDGVSDALSERPLRRSALMRALFTQMGMEPRQWCCAD